MRADKRKGRRNNGKRASLMFDKSLQTASVELPKRRLERQPDPLGFHRLHCHLPPSDFPVIPRCAFGGLKVVPVSWLLFFYSIKVGHLSSKNISSGYLSSKKLSSSLRKPTGYFYWGRFKKHKPTHKHSKQSHFSSCRICCSLLVKTEYRRLICVCELS